MERPRSNNDWRGDLVDDRAGPLVRPYLATGGRTKATVALDRVTLVCSTRKYPLAYLDGQHAEVLLLCAEPRSVAELSAHLRLPVSVIKVLVSDLIDMDAVQQNPPAAYDNDDPDYDVLQRLLDGLKRRL